MEYKNFISKIYEYKLRKLHGKVSLPNISRKRKEKKGGQTRRWGLGKKNIMRTSY